MNNFFRRVPLPVKLMATGLIPCLVLIYISLQLYNKKNQELSLLRDYEERINLSSEIYTLVNVLQNERKLSFDNALKKDSVNELDTQRRLTDSAIKRLTDNKDSILIHFASYTNLDRLPTIRTLIDSNKILPSEVMNFYTTAIFRLNSLNASYPVTAEAFRPLSEEVVSHKLLSDMILHLGILRSNIYNALYENKPLSATLTGSVVGYEIYKSYQVEFLLKGSPAAIESYKFSSQQTALKQTLEFIDTLFTSFETDTTFAAEDWWIISDTAIEALKKLRLNRWQQIRLGMQEIVIKEEKKRDRTMAFLLLTLVTVIGITFYTIYNINNLLTELKFAAQYISEGGTGLKLDPHANDVIGSLTESILKIDQTNKTLTDAAEKIGNGEFEVELIPRSTHDLLGNALVKMKTNLQKFAIENEESAGKLYQMAERYRAIFYKSPLPKWIFDNENLRFLEVNDAAVNHYGYSREDFLKMTIRDIRPEMDLEKINDHVKSASTNQYSSSDYWTHKKKNGDLIKVEITAHLIDYGDKKARMVVVNDVTERKKAEEEILTLHDVLAKSERRFRAMLENNNEIIALVNERAEIVYRSQSSERITGWATDEVSKLTSQKLVHPDDFNFARSLYQEVLSKPGIPVEVSLRFNHKNGHYIWLEGVMTNMLHDDSIKGVISNFKDVTERKEAEEKLIKSEKIYKTIASSIPGSLICLFDKEYRYLLIEGDLLDKFGYSKEKLLGKKAVDVIPMEYYVKILPDLKRVFNDEVFSIQTSREGHDVITRFVPLKDENDQVYAAMTVGIDISELKKAERYIHELNIGLEQKVQERTAQLEMVNKELEAFTYSVSHDLRAPLRIIDGFADILLSDFGPTLGEEGNRILNVIMNNAQRMGQLIDDLLNLSRLGRKGVTVSLVDMNHLVQNIMDDHQFQKIPKAKIIKGDLLPAHCDPSLITQVWSNLLSNAIKYSGKIDQPVITICSTQGVDEVIYSIKDNGVGFNMEYADNLFGVFQRLHKPTEFEGTGVGLALVQRIILKHNGRVWADAAVNKGATFFFSIPDKTLTI